jgi:hypothetical protein
MPDLSCTSSLAKMTSAFGMMVKTKKRNNQNRE